MIFSGRLLEVRKRKKLSQGQLAKAIGEHAQVIGRYERGEVKTSVEVAIKLGEALEVSLDFLVGNTDLEIEKDLLNKIIDIQKLTPKDKEHIIFTLEAMLRDAKARQAYAS